MGSALKPRILKGLASGHEHLRTLGRAPGAARSGARARGRQDRAAGGGDRPDRGVPLGRVRVAGEGRLPRGAHPRVLRRRRRRRARGGARHRGGRARLRDVLADPRGEQARHDAAAARRVGGGQAALPAAGRARRGDVLLRAVGAGGGLGRRRDADPGGADGRRVRAQRREAVDHQRRRVEVLHGDGGDRPGQGRERHHGVRGRGRRRRASASARPSTSWASRGRRPASSTSTTARSRSHAGSATRARGSRSRCAPWTTPASRSRRRPWASRRARSTTRSAT